VSHLSEQQVEAYRRRALSPGELLVVDDHISTCPECRLRLAEGESLSGSLAAWEEVGKGAAVPPPKPWVLRHKVETLLAVLMLAVLIAVPYFQGSRDVVPAISLVDGGRTVRLSPRDELVGLAWLPPKRRREIAAALREGRLEEPREIAKLAGTGSTMRGHPTDPSLTVLAPVVTVVRDGRPTFRWTLFPGAESHQVQVFDPEFRKVAESGPIAGGEWTPERPLPAGGVYTWQIVARRGDVEAIAPGPRSEEARFRVLTAAEAGELERAIGESRGSPLALGVLYARAGLLDEAERELAQVVAANPRSAAARRLLASVQDWRGFVPQVWSPTSTKAAQ